MHKDAFGNDIEPDAIVVYSPLARRGIPFVKVKVIGETPKKVRIQRIDVAPGSYREIQLVEPQRLLVKHA